MVFTINSLPNGHTLLHIEDVGYQYEVEKTSLREIIERLEFAQKYGTDNLDVFNDNLLSGTGTIIPHIHYAE